MNERVGPDAGTKQSPRDLTIGVIGGTGALGRGLATRLARAGHRVLIGSRDTARASSTAQELTGGISGVSNAEASRSDLVFIAVPWDAHETTVSELREHLAGRVVVDCVNPLGFDERGPFALPVQAGSATQQAQGLLPESTVVGAFHHISAELLLAGAEMDADVLVVGDDRDAVAQVIALVDSISGLRGVYAGRLRNAGQVEALTANLIAINRRYRVQSGIRVSGLPSPGGSSH